MHALKSDLIRETVEECFGSDQALISTFHIYSGRPLGECVDKTVSDLNKAETTFQFYQVKEGPKLAGFFGIERGYYLTTIFIHPDYRAKDKIGQVWELIASHFPEEFYTAVFSKNTRAVKFYTRNGAVHSESTADGHPITIFKLRKN